MGTKKKKPNPVGLKRGNIQNLRMGRRSGMFTSLMTEGTSGTTTPVYEGEEEDDEGVDAAEIVHDGEGTGTMTEMIRKEVITCE